MQIDYGDVPFRRAGHVDPRPVRLHKNSLTAISHFDTLHLFSGDSVENGDIRLAGARNKRQLAIWGKLQPIRSLDVGGQSVDDLLARHINDRDRSVVGVGDPDFLAIGRYVKSLGAPTDGNDGFVPVSTRRSRRTTADLFNDADAGGTDVRSDNLGWVSGNTDQVGAILPGTHDPIDPLGCGIVAADHLGNLSRKPYSAACKREPMRATQSAEIDGRQNFFRSQINHGKRVVQAAAVVRDVCSRSVGRGYHFVRIGTDGQFGGYFQAGRVDDKKCVVL